MYKDIHSEMKIIDVFGPVALEADNTPAAIDLKDFRAAEILIGVGVNGVTFTGTNRIDIEVSHSSDNVTYTRPTAADFLGEVAVADGTTGYSIIKSFIEAHAAAQNYRFGYVGGKRYLKILANFGGTHTSNPTPLHVQIVAMRPVMSPVDADA